MKTRPSSPAKYVQSLDGTYYMVSEVAQMLEVSPGLLRKRMRESEDWAPSYTAKIGKMTIYLYTPADVKRITKLMQSQRKPLPFAKAVGRPPIYTPEERKRRQQLYSQRHYWTKKLEGALESDDRETAKHSADKLATIKKELNT